MKNQCQGCQAGWPIEHFIDFKLHVVVGGYDGEKVACSKEKYKEDNDD